MTSGVVAETTKRLLYAGFDGGIDVGVAGE